MALNAHPNSHTDPLRLCGDDNTRHPRGGEASQASTIFVQGLQAIGFITVFNLSMHKDTEPCFRLAHRMPDSQRVTSGGGVHVAMPVAKS
jgi:hypothetical protein